MIRKKKGRRYVAKRRFFAEGKRKDLPTEAGARKGKRVGRNAEREEAPHSAGRKNRGSGTSAVVRGVVRASSCKSEKAVGGEMSRSLLVTVSHQRKYRLLWSRGGHEENTHPLGRGERRNGGRRRQKRDSDRRPSENTKGGRNACVHGRGLWAFVEEKRGRLLR